ncbi:sensor domain-containing diguanylate cyclase [Ensifer adhaerens]|uniref:GGDEF domain-containing protein n=1 Tax=Ensifer adhaerens TaxID=106592 RepID=UPI000DC4892A|nr:GGDEF domain-containing protein [Ensifer adhaerens]RAS15376.1 diguanylate cyclase (GGDEF)-like protein [Ensifer adhaerens]
MLDKTVPRPLVLRPFHHSFWLAGLGVIVFTACVLGILSRPVGMLASIWPANAILLGLLIRKPSLASPAGWLTAALAYVLADLVTGADLYEAAALNAANMVGVVIGFLLYRRFSPEHRHLRRARSVLYMFAASSLAAMGASLVGAVAVHLSFGKPVADAFVAWLTTELVNYVVLLPVFLAAPLPEDGLRSRATRTTVSTASASATVWPFVSLVLSCAAALVIGGPGAFAFPVPALLWCALSYGLFPVTILTAIVCVLTQIAVASGALHLGVSGVAEETLTSTRLGTTLLALCPLAVASVDAARRALIGRLSHAVDYDFLTQCLARATFMARAAALIAAPVARKGGTVVMMLDIDRFKAINDTYGHAVGDQVLVSVAGAVRGTLRFEDLVGRLGGEEFAVVLVRQSPTDALKVAERLLEAVRALHIDLEQGGRIAVTISIGAAEVMTRDTGLDGLLLAADRALYQAKAAGRDRVQCAAPSSAHAT